MSRKVTGADSSRPVKPLDGEVRERFGVLPNFFRLAPESPEITANLWAFACFAYLDNPLPSLFKERLFVYLSRFCEARYCIVRHLGFLTGLGRPAGDGTCGVQTVEEVMPLLRRRLPRGEQAQADIARCANLDAPLTELPPPDSEMEEGLFTCAAHVFLQTSDAPRCRAALERALGELRFQRLTVFLTFVQTAHYWTRMHPALAFEEDVWRLLSLDQELADCVLDDPEAGAGGVSQELIDELETLRVGRLRQDELTRALAATRRSEEALREREERFALVLAGAEAAIWDWDVPNRRVDYSPRWKELRGLSDEDVSDSQQEWSSRIHPDDLDRVMAAVDAHFRGETQVFSEEYRIRHADGQWLWVLDRGIAQRDERGRVIRMAGSETDITERKRAEDERRRLVERLCEADRRKDEFLATLAHELRNPLAPIRTGLEVMKMAADDPATIEDIRGTMERQTRQLIALVDDLLDVSRITRGKLELKKCRVELSDVVHSAVEASRPFIDEAGHELTVDVPEGRLCLNADPHRLAQVVSNLLNNAAKYTPDGGHIRLSAARHGDEVEISVKDSGIGIPAEMLERIFEMFTQIQRPMERSYTGLGIGLTLVKSLLEMHGGRVEVRSEGENRGSEFCVRLPLLRDAPAEAPRADRPDPGPTSTDRRRVLVVDDNRAAADMLSMVVKMLGNEVRTAHDGQEALEVAAEFRPEVVLMDIGMPKMNGYEAARRLRQQPWGENLLLVALTGWGQDEDKQRTKEAGFDYHLVKPAEPSELQRLIATRAEEIA